MNEANRRAEAGTVATVVGLPDEQAWTDELLAIAGSADLHGAVERGLELGCELLGLPIGFTVRATASNLEVVGRHNAAALPDRLPLHTDARDVLGRPTTTLARDLSRADAAGPAVAALDLQALAAVPISAGARRWGAMVFGDTSARPQRFSHHSVMLIDRLGATVSGVIEREIQLGQRIDVEVLQRSNRELAQYASIVAHDLRAPLVTARALLDRLLVPHDTQPSPSSNNDEVGPHLQRSLRRMDTLVDRLLDLATAHEGLAPVSLSPMEVVAEVMADLADDLTEANVSVVNEHIETLVADRRRLTRVIAELVDNSIKYRDPERELQIRIATTGPDEEGMVILAVSDDGPGIPTQWRPAALERSRRLRPAAGTYGAGLGLAYCQRVARLHDGTLALSDGFDGNGLTVSMRFPALPAR